MALLRRLANVDDNARDSIVLVTEFHLRSRIGRRVCFPFFSQTKQSQCWSIDRFRAIRRALISLSLHDRLSAC
jgi:hypothetical protein